MVYRVDRCLQILLGVRDSSDKMVQASLFALAELVPLLGREAAVGGPGQSYFSYGMPKVGTGSGALASFTSLTVWQRWVPVQGPQPVLFLLRHAKGWFRLVGSGQSYFSYGMPKMGTRSGSLARLILLGMPQVGTVSGALVSLTFLRYAKDGYRFGAPSQSNFFYCMLNEGTVSGCPVSLTSHTVCWRWVLVLGP